MLLCPTFSDGTLFAALEGMSRRRTFHSYLSSQFVISVLVMQALGCSAMQRVNRIDDNLGEVSKSAEALPELRGDMELLVEYAASIPQMQQELRTLRSQMNQLEKLSSMPEKLDKVTFYMRDLPQVLGHLENLQSKMNALGSLEEQMNLVSERIGYLEEISAGAASIDGKLDRLERLETQMASMSKAVAPISTLARQATNWPLLFSLGSGALLLIAGVALMQLRSGRAIVAAIEKSRDPLVVPASTLRSEKRTGIGYVS